MIISKTPLRISLVGGGSDLPVFYQQDYGAVLSTTIDKYIYVLIKTRFDDLIVVNWTQQETVHDREELQHQLVREAMKKTGIDQGVEITTIADVPSKGSGLGSSSALTVGLLNAFYTYTGRQVSQERLAQEACEVEIDIAGKPIGKQDQYTAAYGGINEIKFYPDEAVLVSPVNLNNRSIRALNSNLLLYYTGITRQADIILKRMLQQNGKIYTTVCTLRDMVPGLKSKLEQNQLYALGDVLKNTWELKKTLDQGISNGHIDKMYNQALTAGALGGKICGAGGGGFLLLHVPLQKQEAVRQAMIEHREFPFMLEPHGSRIIFNQMSDY